MKESWSTVFVETCTSEWKVCSPHQDWNMESAAWGTASAFEPKTRYSPLLSSCKGFMGRHWLPSHQNCFLCLHQRVLQSCPNHLIVSFFLENKQYNNKITSIKRCPCEKNKTSLITSYMGGSSCKHYLINWKMVFFHSQEILKKASFPKEMLILELLYFCNDFKCWCYSYC